MVFILQDLPEQEVKRRSEQQAAGEMIFTGFARFENSKKLAAVFSAANGGHSYGIGDLLDADNFKYMSEKMRGQVRFATLAMIEKMQAIIDGTENIDTAPAEPVARKEAGEMYPLYRLALRNYG